MTIKLLFDGASYNDIAYEAYYVNKTAKANAPILLAQSVTTPSNKVLKVFGIFDAIGDPRIASFVRAGFVGCMTETEGFVANDYSHALAETINTIDSALNPATNLPINQIVRWEACPDTLAFNQDFVEDIDFTRSCAFLNRNATLSTKIKDFVKCGARTGINFAQSMINRLASPIHIANLRKAALTNGCSAIVTLFTEKCVLIATSGNSRAMICRDGQLELLTPACNLSNPDEMSRVENASDNNKQTLTELERLGVTRCIGLNKLKAQGEQALISSPFVYEVALVPEHEFIVVGNEAVWDAISANAMLELCRKDLSFTNRISKFREVFTSAERAAGLFVFSLKRPL